jgi:hypothetical protein
MLLPLKVAGGPIAPYGMLDFRKPLMAQLTLTHKPAHLGGVQEQAEPVAAPKEACAHLPLRDVVPRHARARDADREGRVPRAAVSGRLMIASLLRLCYVIVSEDFGR